MVKQTTKQLKEVDEVEVVAEAEDEVEVRGCAEVCRATAGKATTGQSDLCAAKAQQATFTKQNGSRGWTTQNCNICGKKQKATDHMIGHNKVLQLKHTASQNYTQSVT